MIAIYILLWLTVGTWVLFLAIMNLRDAEQRSALTLPAKCIGYPLLYIGLLNDFLLNMVICAFVLFEKPQHWLLTGTVTMHLADGSGYKWEVSRWLCKNFLDPFQQGGHCR